MKSKPKIGLALGSGSSRGWSHIGIIGALADLGIEPDIICGTSIGSIVGASFVAGNLPELEDWVRSLTKLETARFFEISSAMNGFVNTKRLHDFLNKCVARDDAAIESFDKAYAAVSTDLQTGREVWFTTGSIIEAVWASISLPGLFPAIRNDGKWLVDGGLVNPVPVSVCKALGADIVIAVNLNGNIAGKHFEQQKKQPNHINRVTGLVTDLVREYTGDLFSSPVSEDQPPSLFDAIAGSVNIAQDRITRSRMAGDPPDILLTPRLAHIGLLEFYRASEAIEEGRNCVQRMQSEIRHVLDMA
ncbi:MAG TPA: patatin-like phospholipase family protein [Gammaproteobacteria bacterium]|nr:patatin-like phospholipase family protein [Gammaproteobacteria bacterium]